MLVFCSLEDKLVNWLTHVKRSELFSAKSGQKVDLFLICFCFPNSWPKLSSACSRLLFAGLADRLLLCKFAGRKNGKFCAVFPLQNHAVLRFWQRKWRTRVYVFCGRGGEEQTTPPPPPRQVKLLQVRETRRVMASFYGQTVMTNRWHGLRVLFKSWLMNCSFISFWWFGDPNLQTQVSSNFGIIPSPSSETQLSQMKILLLFRRTQEAFQWTLEKHNCLRWEVCCRFKFLSNFHKWTLQNPFPGSLGRLPDFPFCMHFGHFPAGHEVRFHTEAIEIRKRAHTLRRNPANPRTEFFPHLQISSLWIGLGGLTMRPLSICDAGGSHWIREIGLYSKYSQNQPPISLC